MATLTAGQRQQISAEVQRRLSQTFTEVPGTKDQVLSAVGHMDDALESAETNLLNNLLYPGTATWLQNNPKIARRILEYVAQVRRENL